MEFEYDEIFIDNPDGSVTMNIPPEICDQAGFNPGDTVIITVEDNKLYIRKQNGKE